MTLLVDMKISSLAKPTNGVGLRMKCRWQVQSLEHLYQNHVLLTTIIDNEMKRSPLDPHLRVKEAFPFLWSSGSLGQTLVVVAVALGLASIICFPPSIFDLESESTSESEAFAQP
jgi:hypothetical protein